MDLDQHITQSQQGMWKERRRAILHLGKSNDPRALHPILAALEDNEILVRWAACRALGNLGLKEGIPGLRRMVEDVEPDVRKEAARALGFIGHYDAVPVLRISLMDDEWSVRQNAAKALGLIGGEQAVPLLMLALGDMSSYVRVAACRSIEHIKDRRFVKPLIHRLGDLDPEVQRAAVTALRQVGETDLASAYANAMIYQLPSVEEFKKIAGKGDVRAVTILVQQFSDRLLTEPIEERLRNTLKAIEEPSQQRLPDLYCTSDRARFSVHEVETGLLQRLPFVACRVCGSTLNAAVFRTVSAVLDQGMEEEVSLFASVCRVNWLQYEILFDFDQVEFGEVSDEEVMAYCLKIANDTDPFRSARRAKMKALIRTHHTLSPNSLNVIQRTFDTVLRAR